MTSMTRVPAFDLWLSGIISYFQPATGHLRLSSRPANSGLTTKNRRVLSGAAFGTTPSEIRSLLSFRLPSLFDATSEASKRANAPLAVSMMRSLSPASMRATVPSGVLRLRSLLSSAARIGGWGEAKRIYVLTPSAKPVC